MMAGFHTRMVDLCRTQKRCYEGPLPCVLVKNEVLSGRRERESSDASLGGFKGYHRVAPKYIATIDFENV
jgi:hypothetical protein